MPTVKRFAFALALTFFALALNAQAQTPQLNGVNLTPEAGRVRASPVGEVFDLRMEVVDESGDTTFSAAQPEAGKPLDWDMTDSRGKKVPPGTYTVTVSYTTQAGKPRKRIEQVLVTEEVTGAGVPAAAGTQKASQAPQASASPSAPAGGQTALVDGGGAANRVPKFTDGDTLTSSSIMEVGSNVSIGKLSAPAAGLRLEVNGATRLTPGGSGGFMEFGKPNTETGLTWLKGTGNTASRADIRFNGARLTLAAGAGAGVPANTGVVITKEGHVGIGEVVPGAYLVVGGTHTVGGSTYTYSAIFNGPVGVEGYLVPRSNGAHSLGLAGLKWKEVHATNGVIQTSDARLKRGVAGIGYGLGELMRLRPVSFEWKEGGDRRKHLGFIAQEAGPVIPEAVARDADPASPLGMNYTVLIPVAVKAIQEQQRQIRQLQGLVARQQARLQEQQARLDQVRRAVRRRAAKR